MTALVKFSVAKRSKTMSCNFDLSVEKKNVDSTLDPWQPFEFYNKRRRSYNQICVKVEAHSC